MPRFALSLAAFAALSLAAAPARAGKAENYYFEVTGVEAKAKGVPADLVESTRAAMVREIGRRAAISDQLPEGAPDPETAPEAFKAWLLRRHMRAFKVTIEITAYQQEVEAGDDSTPQRLRVHTSLHVFGETMPDRSMGFTGDGSATIKLDIGKTLRGRDEKIARKDVLELAVQEAVNESIAQLRAASKGSKKRKRAASDRKKRGR